MINLNLVIGIFFLILGTITIVLSFLLAIKQYLFPPVVTPKISFTLSENLIKLFLQLLDDILNAPPAMAFLTVGFAFETTGIWILAVKPF